MNERIKKLRKSLDLTQQEFANRIGIKRNSYANYETGRNTPLDAIIISICREFNVNENWLRTGEGEMFKETIDNDIQELAEKYNLSKTSYILMEKFLKMEEAQRNVFFDFCQDVVTAALEEKSISIPAHQTKETDIEERVTIYRNYLESKEKATGKLSS